jgi:hypothetical protein
MKKIFVICALMILGMAFITGAGHAEEASYYHDTESWIVRLYTEGAGPTYSVFIEVIDTNNVPVPAENIVGLTTNPQLITSAATKPDISLAFDGTTDTAYVFYTDASSLVLEPVPDITYVAITYGISGNVTESGSPLADVTVILSGDATGVTTSDPAGNYIFTDLSNGSYTLVPSKTGYTFTPSSRQVTISDADVTGQDFTGQPDAGNQLPVADAGPDVNAQVRQNITFDGSGSYDPDGTISSYDWDFGDGKTGTGMIVNHKYRKAGTYVVTLTVTDNDGGTGQDTATVTITK